MKENVVKKVNGFGKIGVVVGHVCRGFSVVAAIGILLFSIGSILLAGKLGDVEYYNGVKWTLNLASFDEEDREEILSEIMESIENDAEGNLVIQESELKVAKGEVSLAVQNDDMSVVSAEYDEENETILIDTRAEDINIFMPLKVVITTICVILTAVAEVITFTFVIKLCRKFKTCETPFSQPIVNDLKKVTLSLIPWCITYPLLEASLEMMATNRFAFSLDLGLIFVVFAINALTYIFRYGAMLQQESDETL